MSDIKDISQHRPFELIIKDAVYNPTLGLMSLKLEESEIAGIEIALTHVFIDPHGEIRAHLHEHNGEILQVFSPVTLFLGQPVKKEDGTYQMKDDKIVVNWNEPIHMQHGDSVKLDEGVAHYFVNSSDSPAHLQFVLPTTHFETDYKGFLDSKLAVKPEVK